MAVLKYRDKYGNLVAVNTYKVNNVLVTNEKGQSQGDVMSQKAVTDELNRIDDEISDLNGRMEGITGDVINELEESLSQKADKSEVTAESNRAKAVESDIKSDVSLINDALADCASTDDVAEVANQLSLKADKSTTYTKTEVDTKVSGKANTADVYTKSQVDSKDQSLRDLIIANADAIAEILADDYFATGIIDCGYI